MACDADGVMEALTETKPNIIFYNFIYKQRLLKRIRDTFPKTQLYSYRIDVQSATLLKARILAGEEELLDFDANTVLETFHEIKIGDKSIFPWIFKKPLPLTEKVYVNGMGNKDILTIDNDFKFLVPPFENCLLSITIDINRIFSISFTASPPDQKEKVIVLKDLSVENSAKTYFLPEKLEMDEQLQAIGISLGNTRCCVGVNRRNGIETVALDNAERLLPSYVAYDENNAKCGKVVVDRMRNHAKSTIFDLKKIIGKNYQQISKNNNWAFELIQIKDSDPHLINGSEWRFHETQSSKPLIKLETEDECVLKCPEEITADLLKYCREKTEGFQGSELSMAVITVPDVFTEDEKNATHAAALLAGWKTVQLLPESIATSFAYFFDKQIPDDFVSLLFDLGGSSLNVYIIRIVNMKIEVLGGNDDLTVGGQSFDKIFLNHFSNLLSDKYNVLELGNKKYKLISECENIKEILSVEDETFLSVDSFDSSIEEDISITRKEFEHMAANLLSQIKNCINNTLNTVNLNVDQISKVLQVGGGCRMPMIKNLLVDMFPEAEQCCHPHPEEVVAIGAVYFAHAVELLQKKFQRLHKEIVKPSYEDVLSKLINDGKNMPIILSETPHTLEKFAAENFREENIHCWKYSKELLNKPLLKKLDDKTIQSVGIMMSYFAILQYMGDVVMNPPPHILEITDFVFFASVSQEFLRDETYCHLMKQLTENPHTESRGWELMWLCTGLFSPSEDLDKEVDQFLKTRASPLATECYIRLQKTKSAGPRKNQPTEIEVQTIRESKNLIPQKIFFPDGSEENFAVESSTKVWELCIQISERFGIDYRNGGISLFIEIGNNVRTMPPGEFYFDAIYSYTYEKWHAQDSVPSSYEYKIYYMRKLWLGGIPGADINADLFLHYHQELPKYLRGYYTCNEISAAENAALILRAQTLDNKEPPWNCLLQIMPDILPKNMLKKKTVAEWKEIILEEFSKMKAKTSNDAKIAFLQNISSQPLFGSAFFKVKQILSDSSLDVLVAINKNGVVLKYNQNVEKDEVCMPMEIILNCGYKDNRFYMLIAHIFKENILCFETPFSIKMFDLLKCYRAAFDKQKNVIPTRRKSL